MADIRVYGDHYHARAALLATGSSDRRTNAEAFKATGTGKLAAVVIEDRETGETAGYHPAAVFVSIGLDPNTACVRGQVALDDRGFVVTDPMFSTNQIRGYLDRMEATA